MNAYQTYRQTQAQTAAPGELVVMLYRGAARFAASAIEAIGVRDVQSAHNHLVKAQAIITELHETLDVERGGEVARNLARIYEYLNRRLVEANLRKDAEPVREVERLVRELLPAWEQAVRQTSTMSAPARPLVGAAV
jgi:flagellar protein FliS